MKPEDYWIARGEDVIGLDVLADGDKARQAQTYQTIADVIMTHDIIDVLDVGCNVAALKKFLLARGFNGLYVGIDTNQNALRIARRFALVEAGDLRNIDYEDKGITCIVVKDVIEHLENIQPLREAFRVASQYVIIATYLPWIAAPSHIVQHPDGYYTNTYNRQSVIDLAHECGFELTETIPTRETNGAPNEVTVWSRRT